MPNIKISEFPAAVGTLSGDDVFPLLQAGVNKKATLSQIAFTTLGLGTLSTQSASAVNITGGEISGLTTPLATQSGGTGATNLTGVIIGNGAAPFTAVAAPNGAIVGTTDTQTLSNKTLETPTINNGYTEEIFTITDGGSVDIDPANGSIQTWTLGASSSPTATGFNNGQSITLMVDDGSAYTITWPSVTWKTDGGVAPTLNTTGFTVIVLWKVGGTLYGARVGDA